MAVEAKEQAEGTTPPAAESQGKTGQAEATSGNQAPAQGDTVSRAEYNKLQSDLDNFKRIEEERKGKEKKRQEELLKEQGKYKDLYDTAVKENEAMKTRLEKLDTMVKGMLEEEMKDLPEDFDKSLIPAGDPMDQIAWLKKAKPIFAAPKAERRGDGTPAARSAEPFAGMKSIYNHPTSPKH